MSDPFLRYDIWLTDEYYRRQEEADWEAQEEEEEGLVEGDEDEARENLMEESDA